MYLADSRGGVYIYVYAVEDDIWMQITGEGNVDVEKMYIAYEVDKVVNIQPKNQMPLLNWNNKWERDTNI